MQAGAHKAGQQQQQQQQQQQHLTEMNRRRGSVDKRAASHSCLEAQGGPPRPRCRRSPSVSVSGKRAPLRGSPGGPPAAPPPWDASSEADASESPHFRLSDAPPSKGKGARSRRGVGGPPCSERGPPKARAPSSDFHSVEASDDPAGDERHSPPWDPHETAAAAAAAAEAAGAARAAARAVAAAAAAGVVSEEASPATAAESPGRILQQRALVRDAAAAHALAATAAAAAETAEVDLFKVAVRIRRDPRLSPQQKAVASQRVIAAALEQEQQRFRGRSRKGRLLWAASRLFRGDSHFLFALPIFCLLALCLCVEVSLYAVVLLLALLVEALFFRIHSAATRLSKQQQQQQQKQQQQQQEESPIPSVVASSIVNLSPQQGGGAPEGGPPCRAGGAATAAGKAAAAAAAAARLCSRLGRPFRAAFKALSLRRRAGASLLGLQQQLEACRDYNSFAAAARELDAATGRTVWKQRECSRLYDASATRQQLEALRAARRDRDPIRLAQEILKALQGPAQAGLKEALYSRTYMDTKDLIEALLLELVSALREVTLLLRTQPHLIPSLQQSIRDIAAQWKQTALVLSGGAMLGLHHFGLIEGLLFNNETGGNLLPKVIAGCSAGAAIAAWLCTRTDAELLKECKERYIADTFRGLSPNNWGSRALNLCRRGYMCDTSAWVSASQKLFRDITFKEAFERTGRCLNIAMTRADRDGEVQLMNHKNAPNVVVWSAVCCSCAFPFLTLPMPLLERHRGDRLSISPPHCQETPCYHDGSLSGDVPLKALSAACGALYTIVSQVNPHVFPFSGIHAHGEAGKPVSWRGAGGQWRGGFVLSGLELLLKEHLRFLLRLIALLNVSPTFRGINARSLALQPYTGDITVSPRRLYWRHLKLMNDQSLDDVQWYVQEGRLMSFPKLHIISNRMKIERAIEALVAAAEAASQLSAAAGGRSSKHRLNSRRRTQMSQTCTP
ncbi:hypothetical protein Esti_005180 [Eimeria stiedai]